MAERRPTKLETFMSVAETVALRSHDAETKVGAVLVKIASDAIVATGHNGFVRGVDDSILPNTRPDKYKYMIHAEENIISFCAKYGIAMDECKLVSTMSPCIKCMRLLWQSGVDYIIAKELYRDFNTEIVNMLDLNVSIQKIDNYYHIRYASRQ